MAPDTIIAAAISDHHPLSANHATAIDLNNIPPSWHTIRPWFPPLTLVVREITSVSVTFILSLSGSAEDTEVEGDDFDLSSLGVDREDGRGGEPYTNGNGYSQRHHEREYTSDRRRRSGSRRDDENADDFDVVVDSTSLSGNGTSPTSGAHRSGDHANEESLSSSTSSTLTNGTTDSTTSTRRSASTLFSTLSKECLTVSVNGTVWQKVFPHFDEASDEAIIIIHGLLPSRQYDILLSLVQPGGGQSNSIRKQVKTEEVTGESTESHSDPETPTFEASGSSDQPALSTPSSSPTPSTPPSNSTNGSGAPLGPLMTLEERRAQLEQTLTSLNSERDTLTASLKSARRESQKGDAALRSEIEVLKRSSEKHAASELRAKQKILALQEALKRAQVATKETEEQIKEVEAKMPSLKRQTAEKERELEKVKEEAEQVKRERDAQGEQHNKRVEGVKAELTGLEHKKERLSSKKEKLETSILPDLEKQLKAIELEIRKGEADVQAAEAAAKLQATVLPPSSSVPQPLGGSIGDLLQKISTDELALDEPYAKHQQSHSTHEYTPPSLGSPFVSAPVQRPRNSSGPGTIGRPSIAPIQRPSPGELANFNTTLTLSPTTVNGVGNSNMSGQTGAGPTSGLGAAYPSHPLWSTTTSTITRPHPSHSVQSSVSSFAAPFPPPGIHMHQQPTTPHTPNLPSKPPPQQQQNPQQSMARRGSLRSSPPSMIAPPGLGGIGLPSPGIIGTLPPSAGVPYMLSPSSTTPPMTGSVNSTSMPPLMGTNANGPPGLSHMAPSVSMSFSTSGSTPSLSASGNSLLSPSTTNGLTTPTSMSAPGLGTTTSTLSRKAAPFEPGKPLKISTAIAGQTGFQPGSIQVLQGPPPTSASAVSSTQQFSQPLHSQLQLQSQFQSSQAHPQLQSQMSQQQQKQGLSPITIMQRPPGRNLFGMGAMGSIGAIGSGGSVGVVGGPVGSANGVGTIGSGINRRSSLNRGPGAMADSSTTGQP
ncbi:hypothetical protein BDN72DRAFT_818305 [Pluteus cervinus]|uniref:Uncharacterized protein n=1 Tax=Pluteus cervinus TaxID=181527 RepID=A0ACD3AYG3_9AGAR|nr:hypothetical protein BDN72DRAFT_818305 [Pluteus cervinus]